MNCHANNSRVLVLGHARTKLDRYQQSKPVQNLDFKKREHVRTTWGQVDGHLCNIFSTLLPGAEASLVAVDEANFMDGGLCSFARTFHLLSGVIG